MKKPAFTDLARFSGAIANYPNEVLAEGVGKNIKIICPLFEFTIGTSSAFTGY